MGRGLWTTQVRLEYSALKGRGKGKGRVVPELNSTTP